MKSIGIHNYYQDFNVKNAIFDNSKYLIGENLGSPFIKLKEELNKKGILINTFDSVDSIDCAIFIDHPTGFENQLNIIKDIPSYLIIMENSLIKPDNYDKNNHIYYTKIFTWCDKLVDNSRYFKYYLPNLIPTNFVKSLFENRKRDKLCCMIASCKYVDGDNQLYGERINVINYFEKFYQNDFDLYGVGWDYRQISYKGTVKSKYETYSNYKFAFCYENAKGFDGYVSEKIFDVMFSGTVPIYYGSKDIDKSLYVDIRDYNNYDDLYKDISTMNDKKYYKYLDNIYSYLMGEDIKKYGIDNFAKTIMDGIGI